MIKGYHVTMGVPDDVSDAAEEDVRAVLTSEPFVAKLRAAVTAVAAFTSLVVLRVRVSL